jgi:hypothetical protein
MSSHELAALELNSVNAVIIITIVIIETLCICNCVWRGTMVAHRKQSTHAGAGALGAVNRRRCIFHGCVVWMQ